MERGIRERNALRTHESIVLSDNLSELTASDDTACTNACTSEPKNPRNPGLDASSSIEEGKTEVMPDSVNSDFAAALKMLASLPLSDEERTEAVRRLIAGNHK